MPATTTATTGAPRSAAPLAAAAGPLALVTGPLLAATDLARFVLLDRDDLVRTATDPLFRFVGVAFAALFSLLVLTAVALHARQATTAGRLGTVGLCAAIVGSVNLGGNMWFEAFAVP